MLKGIFVFNPVKTYRQTERERERGGRGGSERHYIRRRGKKLYLLF
jgi:hypothetical protein